ncbi:hypothetical protein [Parasphingorhabdus halotolerans]|nr:hypothetical protein [Parasphingorhabdus halotolerans]
MSELYNELINKGFRETRWQYIFEGQIGGLVFPYNDGRNEVHVRFYSDRIFSEYEVGRSSFAHFLGPFLNANPFLLDLLKDSVSDDSYALLGEYTKQYRLKDEENALEDWDYQKQTPIGPANREGKRYLLNFELANSLGRFFQWKAVVPITGVMISVFLGLGLGLPVFLVSLLLVLFIYSKLPAMGCP